MEDDTHIGFILELYLSSQGFQVSLCKTIAELADLSEKQLPDVFLLDIMVPDGSGLSFCKLLKQDPDKKHIPVLIMSAHVNADSFSEEHACNDDFIAKPFDLDSLSKLLDKHLR
ncbi:response regulator transcription factor [Pedobacter steynii]